MTHIKLRLLCSYRTKSPPYKALRIDNLSFAGTKFYEKYMGALAQGIHLE